VTPDERLLMKCGHTAQGTTGEGKPTCVICSGIIPGAEIVDESGPDLEGRRARCGYYGKTPTGGTHSSRTCRRGEPCMCEVESSLKLPFFKHKPDSDYDEYYCGCWGWD